MDAISAYAMVEPALLQAQGIEPRILRTLDYGVDFYGDTLFTTRQELRDRPAEVAAMVRASLQGWEYAMQNPAEIADLIVRLEGVTGRGLTRDLVLQQAEGMRPYILPNVVSIGHMNIGRWRHIAEIFASQGMAPADPALEGFLFEPDPPTDPRTRRGLILAGIVVLLGAAGAVLWNTQMRRQVRQRTAELQEEIARRQQSEQRRELQSAALDAAANGIVITDVNGNVVWANAAFSRLTGYSIEEVTGKSTAMLKSGAQDAPFYEHLWKTVQGGKTWQGELKNRRKDGTLYDEEMTITPVRPSGGDITHYIAIKQDVSERKATERRLLRSQRMESVGLLAGGIAHDLNNVLAPVLMSAELLRGSNLPPDLIPIINAVESSARRGAEIVRQVLTFARGMEGEKGPVQLRHLIKDMVQMTSETFPRNIEIRSRLPGDIRAVRGDSTQLHQVLLNLSLNARDAMPNGGSLTFALSNVSLDALSVRLHPGLQEGPQVRIEVTDTGVGIAPEHLDHLFEPFFTTKEQGKGTGLGLATVSGIVRGHNGTISVDSTPGEGTRFTILLPALSVDAPKPAPAKPERPRGNGELLLLVDDEASILRITGTTLRRFGYRILVAGNGAEALERFREKPSEIAGVLTDVMMPVMGGAALLLELKKLKPDLACIASSGLMGASDQVPVDELRAIGVTRLLTKPFSVEELLLAIHEELHPHPPATPPGTQAPG